jgi:hypothetical protein
MRRNVLNNYCLGAFVLTLSMLAAAPNPLAQPRERVERVQFSRGQTSTRISGEAPLGRRDTYIFHVVKGQTISGDVVWQGKRVGRADDQGLSGFIFIEPDGTSYKDPQDFYFVAKATGDYRVVVRAPYRMTNYKYRFELSIAKGNDQTESEDTKQAPVSESAQRLQKYIGRYPREMFKQEHAMIQRLKVLLGKDYDRLELNMDVQGPIQLEEGALVMEGNAPHAGGIEDAYLAITLADGKLHCALRSGDFGGKLKKFSEGPKNMPAFIREIE